MIINERDEQNSKNSRTIDTVSGIYMRGTQEHPLENSMFFQFFEGDRIIGFTIPFRETKQNDNFILCEYVGISNCGQFKDTEEMKKYLTLLPDFLNVFDWSYGASYGNVQYKFTAKYMSPKRAYFIGKGYVNV